LKSFYNSMRVISTYNMEGLDTYTLWLAKG
jgi:hypothetical protein